MTIQECVEVVRSRQQRQWAWQCLSWGLLAGGLLGCLFAALTFFAVTSWTWTLMSLVVPPVIGLAAAYVFPRRLYDAAVSIDRTQGLKDGTSTAIQFMKSSKTPLHELQIEDTGRRVSSVDPVDVAPITAPQPWLAGLTLTCVAAVVAIFVAQPDEVVANVVPNEIVSSQALRIDHSLEELEQFSKEELDPEVEELLKDLAKNIEELKQPEMDPKEALAKLSEMESVLRDQQEKLEQENTEAALQQVGEALTLAKQMQAAGEAMAKGEMEKAAEELAKLEMPEVDRKTEKAITEELKRVENKSNGAAKKELKTAIQQMSKGLSGGDRSKFKSGMEGLAGECKKQGRRKKLSDLLRKQCKCLCECKSECEGACKSDGAGKCGSNWGLGASGNQPGDKTSKLATSPKMDIKGKESNQGDVDVETISSEEQSQEAVREYREKADKYEQLSESVLSSEPIPLGYRQTIRRYFELIRPQAGETDAVNQQLDEVEK